MNDHELFSALCVEIGKHVPGFKVRYKRSSFFMKALGLVVGIFNRGFMTKYTTTIGTTVYFPSYAFVEENPAGALQVLAHEFVHMHDDQKSPLKYKLSYLFPQVLLVPLLVVTAALAYFVPGQWWIVAAAAALVSLGPWPSSGRTELELRGYGMTLAVMYWLSGKQASLETHASMRGYFTGPAYYFMCRDAEKIDAALAGYAWQIGRGTIVQEAPYGTVYSFLASHGRVVSPYV